MEKSFKCGQAMADDLLEKAKLMAYEWEDAPNDTMILVCLYRILCGDEAPVLH